MDADPITLPDDPRAALAEIASYLREVRRDAGRAIWHGADGNPRLGPRQHTRWAMAGYWQTTEYLDGLDDIASECDRLAAKPRRDWTDWLCRVTAIAVLLFIVVYTVLYALR